ncbi:riboflavin synthase [Thermanaerovibrio velox]|uniref:riboflavin synthase n=1 Tax=Thermanaerovibrio velox TaxID=108007 RepID=UPI0002EB6177|nr:riboflavin synthase [Thermanaerovibrio velox]
MFTGLIGAVGKVVSVKPVGGDVWEMQVDSVDDFLSGVSIGDSVAVDGVCLTVTAIKGTRIVAQMMRETVERTKLGSLKSGHRVNLELSMRLDGRLDGHIVQGHVDCLGIVDSWEAQGSWRKLWVSVPRWFAPYVVPKGSVAIDGVSLTVIDALDDAFSVGLIPETLRRTCLGDLRIGDKVNLEGDIIGKYVMRWLGIFGGASMKPGEGVDVGLEEGGISYDKLALYGWDVGGR